MILIVKARVITSNQNHNVFLFGLKHSPLRSLCMCVYMCVCMKYAINKLYYGSEKPHLGNDCEPDKTEKNENGQSLPSSQVDRSYALQEQPLLFLPPSSSKTSDLFHLPQTKDS